eukprot:c47448_g1_i1 orf=296-631(+)
MNLWRNECLQMFYDRLISDIESLTLCLLRSKHETDLPSVLKVPIIFGDYLNVLDVSDEDLGEYFLSNILQVHLAASVIFRVSPPIIPHIIVWQKSVLVVCSEKGRDWCYVM